MLTYIQINAAKPREKAWTLSDSQSLYLVIQPDGSKLWRFNYRFLDKQKKLHLGGWPTISLAEARVRRDEAKRKIAVGIDPALEKKRARIAAKFAAANTFQAVAEEWLVKCERDGFAPVPERRSAGRSAALSIRDGAAKPRAKRSSGRPGRSASR